MSDTRPSPVDYLRHGSHSMSSAACRRLIHRRGFDGYGRLWAVCEAIAASEGVSLPWGCDEDREILAATLGMDARECGEFVSELLGLGLVREEGGFLRCREADDAFEAVQRYKERAQKAAKGRWGKRNGR